MHVYILKSLKHNWYYVGLSIDANQRFLAHNAGWVKKTKFYRPFKLVHVELTGGRKEARLLEKYFKSGYGREIIKEIEEELTI